MPTKMMKFAFDLHGVIDASPQIFAAITQALRASGHEVHVLTGEAVSTEMMEQLMQWGIEYTHLFSIVGYHQAIGTEIKWDTRGNPHIDPYLWDRTKGQYCENQGIDLHLDDSDIYGYFFKTPYARFFSKDTRRVKKLKVK